jgi:hypothetical protein
MAAIVLRSIAALALGFFSGWIVVAAACFRYADAAGIFDRDGGGAMGIIFILGPLGGLLIAFALGGYTLWRGLDRKRRAEAGEPQAAVSPVGRWAMAPVAAVITYLVVWFFIEAFGPYQLAATAKLLLTECVPVAVGLIAGLVASKVGRSARA